jgi:hypothetical protein
VKKEQQTTLNTMSTANLAENEPESLREVREFEDIKAIIQVIHQKAQQI